MPPWLAMVVRGPSEDILDALVSERLVQAHKFGRAHNIGMQNDGEFSRGQGRASNGSAVGILRLIS